MWVFFYQEVNMKEPKNKDTLNLQEMVTYRWLVRMHDKTAIAKHCNFNNATVIIQLKQSTSQLPSSRLLKHINKIERLGYIKLYRTKFAGIYFSLTEKCQEA
jgi:DNA-binding MarR family transcriptional regulator